MLLEINHLFFSYRPDQPLFRNFNLQIDEGKIVALAGESGCGKSTLLSLIYGLLDWQDGEILYKNVAIGGPKKNLVPGEEDMKLVAQNYDLMPYATVAENVGKFISNIRLQEKNDRVDELLDVMGLLEFRNTLPKNLSGGQQQRVAIARALSVLPNLLLLDEPFSNIDFSRKVELRQRLFNYVKDKNISLIISTHEIQEIMPWLDQIIVLKDGRLIQNDGAKETYTNPYNAYVAQLFSEVNIFSEEEMTKWNLEKQLYYPHQIIVADDGIIAQVLESRFSGSFYWNKISLEDKPLIVHSSKELNGYVSIAFDNN